MEWARRHAIQPPAFFVARMLKRADRSGRDSDGHAASSAPSSVIADLAQTRPCCVGSKQKSTNVSLLTFDSVNRCNGFKVVLKLLTESWVERKPLVMERVEPWLLFSSLHDDERFACVTLPIDPPVPDCRID